jgi:iron only hydrogenase large subunit-like protein
MNIFIAVDSEIFQFTEKKFNLINTFISRYNFTAVLQTFKMAAAVFIKCARTLNGERLTKCFRMKSFQALGVNDVIANRLAELGIREPTEIQEKVSTRSGAVTCTTLLGPRTSGLSLNNLIFNQSTLYFTYVGYNYSI